VDDATSISTISLVDIEVESFPPYIYVPIPWVKAHQNYRRGAPSLGNLLCSKLEFSPFLSCRRRPSGHLICVRLVRAPIFISHVYVLCTYFHYQICLLCFRPFRPCSMALSRRRVADDRRPLPLLSLLRVPVSHTSSSSDVAAKARQCQRIAGHEDRLKSHRCLTSATHAAAMYVGFPPWGLGHLEVLGGKSRTARGSHVKHLLLPSFSSSGQAAKLGHHLYRCTWEQIHQRHAPEHQEVIFGDSTRDHPREPWHLAFQFILSFIIKSLLIALS
jgi:hypothetical protein